jgi:hypothetical protein
MDPITEIPILEEKKDTVMLVITRTTLSVA